MKPTILYIHGANSTKRSFAWLHHALALDHKAVFFEYDTHQPAFENIQLCQVTVEKVKPSAIIGHSLGGIMMAYMQTDAKKVAIAAPFGGSAIANWLPMYSQLMRDVATTSQIVRGVRLMKVKSSEFLAIVANGLDGGGFDGVLSATSQTALDGADYRVYDLNHFEVLVDESVASVIDDFLCPPAMS